MIFPRILRSSRLTFMLALLMTAAVALSAQSAQDTGTDLKFHKFQPKVPPEQAAKTAAAQLPGPAGMSAGAAQQIQAVLACQAGDGPLKTNRREVGASAISLR